jgi:hypothetical protein
VRILDVASRKFFSWRSRPAPRYAPTDTKRLKYVKDVGIDSIGCIPCSNTLAAATAAFTSVNIGSKVNLHPWSAPPSIPDVRLRKSFREAHIFRPD